MHRAVHPHSLLRAMLPFELSQSLPHRAPLSHCCRCARRRDACTPPGCVVPPKAHYPERHTASRSRSHRRAVTAPVNLARYSGSDRSRSCATPLLARRCPSLRSNNRRLFASPADDPEFHDHPRDVPDKRADPGKLPPEDFRTPCAATVRRSLRPHENEAPRVNASHSSASEWRTSAHRAKLERGGHEPFSNSDNEKLLPAE